MKIQLIALLFSVQAFGSAIVQLDSNRNLITVHGEIIFYGAQASEEIAQKAANEVQTYWNAGSNTEPATPYLTTMIKGKSYQVVFEITHKVVSEQVANEMMQSNPSPELTFIKILQGVTANGDRSYMTSLGSNQGVWYLSDDIGKSTTTAHEFGHGLGLDHPIEEDWRGRGQPSIMCPRGTVVDAFYQWNPAAPAGAAGGTISPYKRKLIQWDINNLQFSVLEYSSTGIAALNQGLSETPWSNKPTVNFSQF